MNEDGNKHLTQNIRGHGNYMAGRDLYITTGKLPSLLETIIPAIQDQIDNGVSEEWAIGEPYGIEEKIKYNNLNGYQYLIDEYAEYGSAVDQMYDAFDRDNPGTKNKIFRFIRAIYLRKKSQLGSNSTKEEIMQVIRMNSDKIFEETIEEIKNLLIKTSLELEQVEFGAQIIVSHAFINCKILERPNAD